METKLKQRQEEIFAQKAIEQKKEDSASSYYDSEYESEQGSLDKEEPGTDEDQNTNEV